MKQVMICYFSSHFVNADTPSASTLAVALVTLTFLGVAAVPGSLSGNGKQCGYVILRRRGMYSCPLTKHLLRHLADSSVNNMGMDPAFTGLVVLREADKK